MQRIVLNTMKIGLAVAITGMFYLMGCESEMSEPKVSSTIPTSGGFLSSSDNALSVSFPDGAFTTATEVSILKTQEVAPKGIGTVYKITPEGMTFNKPVTISFGYTPEDATKTPAALMALAYKKADGSWQVMPTTGIDTKKRTISTQSTHFSDWALVEVQEGVSFSFMGRTKENLPAELSVYPIDTVRVHQIQDTTMAITIAKNINVYPYFELVCSYPFAEKRYADTLLYSGNANFCSLAYSSPEGDFYGGFFRRSDDPSLITYNPSITYVDIVQKAHAVGEYTVGNFSMRMAGLSKADTINTFRAQMTGSFRVKYTNKTLKNTGAGYF